MMKPNNQAGISLVETLAVIVIGTIFISFLYSILHQSQKQYNEQTKVNQQINDAAYALKLITKEIRKNTIINVSADNKTLNLGSPDEKMQFSFNTDKNAIEQNGEAIVYDIDNFNATKLGGKITISIVVKTGKTYTTDIFIRGG